MKLRFVCYFWIIAGLLLFTEHASAKLIFSEYIEGSGWNKALEIYNSGESVDFDLDNYRIDIFTNGSSQVKKSVRLSGGVEAGSSFVVAHSRADHLVLNVADQVSNQLSFNGDDALILVAGDTILDRIGQVGFDPGVAWGDGGGSTQNHTLVRLDTIHVGDWDYAAPFFLHEQWRSYDMDTFSFLGRHDIADVNVVLLPETVFWLCVGGLIMWWVCAKAKLRMLLAASSTYRLNNVRSFL